MLRILFRIRLSYLLIGFYVAIFIVAGFVSSDFVAVSFDSGGVTTGPMTVPFIMALGLGVSLIRSDKNAESDSFGLVALCSIGPIIAVLILGLVFTPVSYTHLINDGGNPINAPIETHITIIDCISVLLISGITEVKIPPISRKKISGTI